MKHKNKLLSKAISYIVLIVIGCIMIYPLVWLFFATFKSNNEIFGNKALLPSSYSLDAYINGWKGSGKVTYLDFFRNTFSIVIPVVFLTVIAAVLISYGFARFNFKFKKVLFTAMLATMMLPSSVTIVPQYIMFREFGWLNTYKVFIIPAMFGGPFFIFMMVQFLRGIPKELDEAAYIDGCNTFRILWQILVPLCKPAIFSIIVFQFLWTWNDFFGPLIYLNSVKKYTIALGLRMSIDTQASIAWPNIMAMSLLSIIPSILLFFFAQNYFVEGITTTGIKG
jgi:oligogalacturonide transport system permease protein